jgi:hypothetical protein
MFPNIKRVKSQTMNHMKYIYDKKSQKYLRNDKVQLSYVKNPIPTQQLFAKHDVQSNKIEHNINKGKHT